MERQPLPVYRNGGRSLYCIDRIAICLYLDPSRKLEITPKARDSVGPILRNEVALWEGRKPPLISLSLPIPSPRTALSPQPELRGLYQHAMVKI